LWALPFGAGILIGLLTIGDDHWTALRVIGVALLAVAFTVFAGNLIAVRTRGRRSSRGG
jgi:hypothetical protein